MPLTHSLTKTTRGNELVRMSLSGRVEGTEVDNVVKLWNQGGPYAGRWLFVAFEKGTDLSAEARRSFLEAFKPGGSIGPIPAGIVTPSALLRTLVNFMIRMTGTEQNKARLFGSEEEALSYLNGLP